MVSYAKIFVYFDNRKPSHISRTIPLIFRVVNQIWLPNSPDLAYLPQLRQSAGPSVQHLMIDKVSSDDSLITILSSCPNVRNLAIYLPTSWEEDELNPLLPTLKKMTRLTRLRAGLSCVCYAELLIPPFLNLTHLEILLSSGRSWGEWEALTHLPKLTHISVGCSIQVNDVLRLLKDCRRLKVLILVPYHSTQDLDTLYGVDDNRLILLGRLNYVDSIIDWEKGANGGVDTWVFAELVVVARDSESFGF